MKLNKKWKIYLKLCLLIFILSFNPKLIFSQINTEKISTNQGLTLQDCYQKALQQSETIAIKQQQIEEAKAQLLNAWSTISPHVSFLYTYLRSSTYPIKSAPTYVAQANSQDARFTLTQPLFSGFKEYAGLAAAKHLNQQRSSEELYAEQILMDDVADAYYILISERKSEQILEEIDKLLNQRIDDLTQRVNLGRSRPSDLSSTRVLLYQNLAQIESVKSLEQNSIELLKFLTGLETIGPLNDADQIPEKLEEEHVYLAKASIRPDVEAAKEAYQVNQEQIAISRGNFFPSISLMGDYYPEATGKFTTPDWDISLALQLPLLPSIDNIGNLNQAKAQAKEAEKNYELINRNALYNIQTAYDNLKSAFLRRAAYAKALKAAEENYLLQKVDYESHLISNIDFLQVIQTLQNSRMDYMNILYQTKQLYWNFKVAIGEL